MLELQKNITFTAEFGPLQSARLDSGRKYNAFVSLGGFKLSKRKIHLILATYY